MQTGFSFSGVTGFSSVAFVGDPSGVVAGVCDRDLMMYDEKVGRFDGLLQKNAK